MTIREWFVQRAQTLALRLLLAGFGILFASGSLAEDSLRLSQITPESLVENLSGGILLSHQHPAVSALQRDFTDSPNFGYINKEEKAWLKLRVENDTDTDDWVLRINSEAADYIDFYRTPPGHSFDLDSPSFLGGDQRSNEPRHYHFPSYFVPLAIPPGQAGDIYIAVYGKSTLALDIDLGQEASQIQAATNDLALDVLLISIACAMLLFNLVMWRMDGERFRLSYVLYLSGIIVFTLYNSGLGYLYLWRDWPYLQQVITYFSLSIFFWGGYRFCQQFLRTHTFFPRLHRFINVVAYLGFLAIPLGLINALREAVLVVSVANLLFFAVVIFLGIAATCKRLNSARLFLVAWSVLVICTLTYNAYVQGLLAPNFFVQRAVVFGVAFESLLMSIAQANYLRNSHLERAYREQLAKEAAEAATEQLDEALSNAQKANRSKDEFLRLVSHELRTPLNHSLGMIDQLCDSGLTEAQRVRCQILAESTRLTHRQVENLLSYAELNAYRLTTRPRDQDIRPALQELCEEGCQAGQRNGHTIDVRGLSGLPEQLNIDWLQTRQILEHLLDNALRYSHPGTIQLDLRFDAEQSWLVFQLTDPGPGINEDILEANDAFQVRQFNDSNQPNGLGLGIYLSRALAGIIKASLSIENQQGKTVVELAVPAKATQEEPKAQTSAANTVKLAAKRILVVEDNLLNMKVLTAMLTHEGCQWETAYEGKSAVDLAAARPYDLILMDCQVPVMDGFEATRIIRGSGGPNADTPIVAVTANSMSKDREQVFASGMNDIIPKPYSRPLLVERLLHWLNKSRQDIA